MASWYTAVVSQPDPECLRLVVVEDDPAFSEVLVAGLTAEGHHVCAAATVADGLAALHHDTDLLLLDLEVDGQDGMAVLHYLRRHDNPLPVIIMTGYRVEADDTVTGLEEGADDYLRKPFALKELLARIHAVLRRHHTGATALVAAGDLEIDRLTRTAACRGTPLALTVRELELLALLAEQPGREVSRADVLSTIWRDSLRSTTLDNTLDVHISRLRKKLQQAQSRCAIETVWGKGFRLTVEGA